MKRRKKPTKISQIFTSKPQGVNRFSSSSLKIFFLLLFSNQIFLASCWFIDSSLIGEMRFVKEVVGYGFLMRGKLKRKIESGIYFVSAARWKFKSHHRFLVVLIFLVGLKLVEAIDKLIFKRCVMVLTGFLRF